MSALKDSIIMTKNSLKQVNIIFVYNINAYTHCIIFKGDKRYNS